MFDYLEGYLDTLTTPETGTLILNATKALYDNGIDDHLFPIRNELDRAENETQDIVSEGLESILITFYLRAIRELGVTMDPETDLDHLYSVFVALLRVEDWDDKNTLNALAEPIEGNEAALCDILEVVGDRSSADYMQYVLEVTPDLLKRIYEITTEESYNPLPDEVVVAGAQTRLRTLFSRANFQEDSLFVKALDEGLRLGLPFEMVLKPNMEQLHEVPLKDLGRELVAFAFASSAPNDEIPALLAKVRENFELPVMDQMRLDQDIKRLL